MQESERWAWIEARAEALRRSLRGRLPDYDAEDVAQEALLRAGESRASLPADSRGVAWLRRIALNVAIDRRRRDRRLEPLDLASHVTAIAGAIGETYDIAQALKALPQRDRKLLTQIARGMRYQELAQSEGVDAATIRKRVARARARLLVLLKEGP